MLKIQQATRWNVEGRTVSLDALRGLNTKELRLFFTSVRRKLGLNTFDWPESARRRFAKISNDSLPSGPGRANSGRCSLLLILQLSVDTDEVWSRAVREQLHLLGINTDFGRGNALCDEKTESSKDKLNRGEELNTCELRRECDEMNEEDWGDVIGYNNRGEAFEMAKDIPKDTMIVRIPKQQWVGLGTLVKSLQYPLVKCASGWYIQRTPPDGNCLFSAILTAAKVRGLLPSNASSVASIRVLMRSWLGQLARAGRRSSPFRREWLASCVYDLDGEFEASNVKMLEEALLTSADEDVETFLAPLRVYVLNWSKKVGSNHWGGLLRVELSILASITNSAVEILDVVGDAIQTQCRDSNSIQMCDTRDGNRIVSVTRRDLVFPVKTTLPSMNNRFLGPIVTGSTNSGWLGPYPVLRVVLNRHHYDVCTSKFSYPIRNPTEELHTNSLAPWLTSRGILVEPYAALTKQEQHCWERAINLIEGWREARSASDEQGKHADMVLLQSKSTVLSVSMLSHLQSPDAETGGCSTDYMLNDEIITCYMHLLESRNEVLSRSRFQKG